MSQFPTLSPYWRWQAANKEGLPDALLKVFEKETKKNKYAPAAVGDVHGSNSAVDPNVRKSETFFLESHHWMLGALFNYGVHANAAAQWGFTLTAGETLQVTRYGLNEFYDFHTDCMPVSSAPYVRKVSVVCCLSNPDEYEGGEFEFERGEKFKLARGDIIAFPSAAVHRVCPVTSGERRSLVTWIVGPNLK